MTSADTAGLQARCPPSVADLDEGTLYQSDGGRLTIEQIGLAA